MVSRRALAALALALPLAGCSGNAQPVNVGGWDPWPWDQHVSVTHVHVLAPSAPLTPSRPRSATPAPAKPAAPAAKPLSLSKAPASTSGRK